jgi:peptidoglycan hydrolase-like protein with peptidoglycan-binding domain
MKKVILFIISLLCIYTIALPVKADTLGQRQLFNVSPSYDTTKRQQVSAVLVKATTHLYFYVDEDWWNFTSQSDITRVLSDLGSEFDNRIYPTLSNTFGSERNPVIDKDGMITVLIHPMVKDAGGYVRSNDQYVKLQVPDSNEREIVYLNSNNISAPIAKSLLAHEFMHLITFNQKDIKYDVSEDTWLNEARSEYVASVLLGYDEPYAGSYLEKRVQDFSENPHGSLTDWQDSKYDYGVATLFIDYLADQYGMNVLVDSLHSSKIGVDSINYALAKNGIKDTFSQVFQNWMVAVVVNDCNYGPRYCYINNNLKNFHLFPSINFLPLTGSTTLTISDSGKLWSGNWYKIIGGSGETLNFSFTGDSSATFSLSYILKSQSGGYTIKTITVNKSQKGTFSVDGFGKDIVSLVVLPLVVSDTSSVDGVAHSFVWSASINRGQPNTSDEITKLLDQISSLKKQIADILAQQNGQTPSTVACSAITTNLYLGIMHSDQVTCLQQFLKSQGTTIYPEGLVTGNFGSLTKAAVMRFQQKYQSDILNPLGLVQPTGFVGLSTRSKINQLLSS